ncbi:hypothetical protein FACS1894147_09320 [Spirochaetia bacterium]|nr:hypothetical protein FACS1894147_09320 [Spirochaetia bacterium]
MYENQPLNILFNRYSTGTLERKEFEGLVFRHILDNHRLFRLYPWTKDQCSDFLSWLYPRLSRAVDLYRNTGSTFGAYISALVYWNAREYRAKVADHRITEYACWRARAEEMELHENEPEYGETVSAGPKITAQVSNPRQILALILKSYCFLSDDFLTRVSPAVGMSPAKLKGMIGDLRQVRVKRDEDIRALRGRVDNQYYRCVCFEQRLRAAGEDTAFYGKMQGRLARAKIRFESMKKRLAGNRLDASNREVADILQLKKGSVDSSLYLLKEKWKNL